MKNWKDVYQLPLRQMPPSSWVRDDANNFVFEFETGDENLRNILIDVINGDFDFVGKRKFNHKDGLIKDELNKEYILIRGWGNLTGVGGMNLPEEEAANIQDTFAEFIVSRLNYHK